MEINNMRTHTQTPQAPSQVNSNFDSSSSSLPIASRKYEMVQLDLTNAYLHAPIKDAYLHALIRPSELILAEGFFYGAHLFEGGQLSFAVLPQFGEGN
jgi:hypothetical protein